MPEIHQKLFIGAGAEKIYAALTRQEGLAAWWTPGAETSAAEDLIARFPFGNGYFKEMKITGIRPPKSVQWLCMAGSEEWMGTRLFFELEHGDKRDLLASQPEMQDQLEQHGADEGTLLTFRHEGWKEYSAMFAECSYTWGRFLNSLKLFCETGVGRPWPSQHDTRL